MNERIRELAEQAGGNPNYKAFRGYFLPPPPDYIDPATVNLEKFAELIVEQVYDYILNATFEDEPWPSRKDVKQHFGVEL